MVGRVKADSSILSPYPLPSLPHLRLNGLSKHEKQGAYDKDNDQLRLDHNTMHQSNTNRAKWP
jgi:hypothetical protein